DFKSPFLGFQEEPLVGPATAAHIDALTSCLTSVPSVLDIVMHLDPKGILCLPTVSFSRTSYATIALIKLHCTVSIPSNRLGEVFELADLDVEARLDSVID